MTDTRRRALSSAASRLPVRVLSLVVVVWVAIVVSIPTELRSALLGLIVVLVPLTVVSLQSSESSARRWTRERGAEIAPRGIDQLRRQLQRTRIARTLGVTGAFATNFMLMGHFNANPDGARWYVDTWVPISGTYALAGTGYVVGSWWAEATKVRDNLSEGAGTAVLARRRLADYLDPVTKWMLVAYVGVVLAAVGVWRFGPHSSLPAASQSGWSVIMPAGVAGVAMAVAVWTVRRRELATDDSSLAYEELTRNATANAMCGVTVAMLGALASEVVALPTAAGATSTWWTQLIFYVADLLGVGFWIGSGSKMVFRTRRIAKLGLA